MKPKPYKRQPEDENDEDFEENFETLKKWYEELPDDPEDFEEVSDQQLIELKEKAKKHLEAETNSMQTRKTNNKSDFQWMKTVLSKGTITDKIAAYTVTIQNDPVCSLNVLHNVVGTIKAGKKKECLVTINILSELFLSDLLPPNRKLIPFYKRPFSKLESNAMNKKRLLMLWYFEDQLKEIYTSFIQALNKMAHDTIDANKEKAISSMFMLLSGHPEQEKNLLNNIVNKLGDPSQKIASKAIYCLSQLLFHHPNMKEIVLQEVEKLLFRQNVTTRAQYYGICFLSQFYLSNDEVEVARKLITIYFSFFKACVKKGEVDSRMMSVLLIGVNRAYPFAKMEMEKMVQHIDTMFKIVHLANFNTSLHALNLLYQISDSNESIKIRYFQALYKKIISPHVITSTHQALLLNIIFRSLKKDTDLKRIKAFIKRILQICCNLPVQMTCGLLFLISQLNKERKGLVVCSQKATHAILNSGEENLCKVNEEKQIDNTEITPVVNDKLELNEKKDEFDWNLKDEKIEKKITKITHYSPFERNPEFSGGEFCVHYELIHLERHFHPTVALFASKLINGEKIDYSGDPLKDFSTTAFLDRFVFKNPKKYDVLENKLKGRHFSFGQRQNYIPRGIRSKPITSSFYLNENKNKIPIDELFLYEFLQKRRNTVTEDKEDDSDNDSVASDEFEELLNKMTGSKNSKEEDVDYMNEVGDSFKIAHMNDKRNKEDENNESDSGESDESDSGESLENESDSDGNMNSEDNISDDELNEDQFSDADSNSDEDSMESFKVQKKNKKKPLSAVFAPAEEFAMMLENMGTSKSKPGSINAMFNKDKATQKQIHWEEKRNQMMFDKKKVMGDNKFNNKRKKNFKNQQKNNKMSKKFKK